MGVELDLDAAVANTVYRARQQSRQANVPKPRNSKKKQKHNSNGSASESMRRKKFERRLRA
eukprot:6207533-Pleurochrysis_carterae.AAC.2